ncbi:uncharacterized protein G2W53_008750 [Senna tora]|uniref:Uncharacterized protein n=1 Tax=Senna tora TaxID=362788 RepID=A0A835C6S4_9FABA|nr:uncharacterized protein G2W53_008750 [Senna tora]
MPNTSSRQGRCNLVALLTNARCIFRESNVPSPSLMSAS